MTQPVQYRLGVIAFVGTCLVVYSLIAYFHKQLLPIVGAMNPALQHTIEQSMSNGSLPYPLVVIFSAAIFVSLLKNEKDWNPIFLLRRVVHGWVSIPQIANALMVMMRDQLVVPVNERANVARDPHTPYVTVDDFTKDRLSLDRCWAELCYIRLWLERHRARGSHFTFFNEPSFAWERLQENYNDARDRIAVLKRSHLTDTNGEMIFADVVKEVDTLRRQYCRLAACFLVFKNETKKDAFRDAKQFGVTITPDVPRANPLRYTAIFFGAIIIAIYFGVSLSAMSWDLLHHNPLTLEPDVTTKWMLYALASYGIPIMAVLLLRYLGWRSDRSQPNSYLVSYAAIFLVALCVSAVCLTIAKMVFAQMVSGQDPAAVASFGQALYKNVKWSISPGVAAIYVVYRVDRQIDPLSPDISPFEHWRLPQRLMGCVLFGFVVAAFSVLPTVSISTARPPWPVGKLHLVIIGTIFIIGLTMALVGEFLLTKPTAASSRLEGTDSLPAEVVASKPPPLGTWALAGSLATVLLIGLAIWAHHPFPPSVVPQWAFVNKPVYLSERIPLAWTYGLPAPAASARFEVESRAAGGVFSLEGCTDTEHYYVDRINGTRDWRVRAVADCGTRTPISDWSQAITVTQYDSAYQRIKSKGQVDIFVSASQDQDVFKWGDQGFDIDLTKFIARDLSARIGRELKLAWRPVPWEKLLPAVGDGSADLAISAITRTSPREKTFSIQFTDSYYCTTYALIYRVDTQEGRIRDMVKGKTVGVQRKTTSSDLANKLAGDGLFSVKEFDNNESLQNALLESRIDFGVTDTSVAQSAQLGMRLGNGADRLKFKQFGQGDLPSMQDERTQQYAIAVHRGEIELLNAVNETLAKAKQDGELSTLFKTATDGYEVFKHYPSGSRSLGQRPWDCPGQTTVSLAKPSLSSSLAGHPPVAAATIGP